MVELTPHLRGFGHPKRESARPPFGAGKMGTRGIGGQFGSDSYRIKPRLIEVRTLGENRPIPQFKSTSEQVGFDLRRTQR